MSHLKAKYFERKLSYCMILNGLRSVIFFVTALIFSQTLSAQLVINEISNGPTGNEEFIELVVQCDDPGGVRDIRNWIFDDNSGIGTTCDSGQSITCGHARFSYDVQWAAVPCGSIILIYNDGNVPPNMPTVDPYDSNKDFIYVIPASHQDLLVSDSASPGYTTALGGCNDLCNNFNPPLEPGMLWAQGEQMRLDDDADLVQVRSANGSLSQIVVYGYDDLSQFPSSVKFDETGMAKAFQLNNAVSDNFLDQNNWTSLDAVDDSPASANSNDNLDWIVSMQLDLEIVNRNIVCEDNAETIQFGVKGYGYDGVEWNFGDLSSGVSNAATGAQAIHNFVLDDPSQAEVFLITAKVNYPPFNQVIEKSFVVEVGPIGPDPSWEPFSVCVDSGNFLLDDYLHGTPGGVWSGDVVNSGYVVTQDLDVGEYDLTYTVIENGCERSLTQTIQANLNADANWETLSICKEENAYDLNQLVTGQVGGEWLGDLSHNAGLFNPADYTPGVYNMTYLVGDGNCESNFTNTIEITDEADASIQGASTCTSTPLFDLSSLVLGDAGGDWSGDQVVDGYFTTTGLFPGEYEVTYTVGSGGCEKSSTEIITIGESMDPSFQDTLLCVFGSSINLNELILGNSGGTFIGEGVVDNEWLYDGFDPGPYEITYVVGPCQDAQTKTIYLIQDSSPAWEPQVLCYSGSPISLDHLPTFDSGGFWSGGFYVNNNVFDPTGLPPGAYSLTYTVGPYPCLHSETHDILVVIEADPSWETTSICQEQEPMELDALVNGHAGGVWTGGEYIVDGFFNPADLQTGTYEVTYTVGSDDCEAQSTQTIEVIGGGDATWEADFVCQSDAAFDLNNWIQGDQGGTWYMNEVEIDNIIDPTTLDVGTHELIYLLEGVICNSTFISTFEIGDQSDPLWSDITICSGSGNIDLNNQILGTPNGTWSGEEINQDGIFTTDGLTAGVYEVEYHVGDGICARSHLGMVTLLPVPDPTWNNQSFCEGDDVVNLFDLVSGTPGGTWWAFGDEIANPSSFVIENFSVGEYELTYTVEVDGCSDSQTKEFEILAYPEPDWESHILCLNQLPLELNDLVQGTEGGEWSGDGVTEEGTFDPLDTNQGDYLVSYTVTNEDCETSLSQLVEIIPLWQEPIEISGETEITLSENTQLEATGALEYIWSPAEGLSCTDCPNPVAKPLETTTYTVQGIDQCTQFSSITVEVDAQFQMDLPTAFTPNDDGINDVFRPITKNVVEFEMRVFNRWGAEIYHSTDSETGWDGSFKGQESDMGSYVYMAAFKYYGQDRVRTKKGSITLIR